jgi:PAS domain S-box-containing protein
MNATRETAQEREQHYQNMLEALPVGIYATDAAGTITYYNPAAAEFAGRRPEIGTDKWCVTLRRFWPDGTPMPHDAYPLALTLKEGRPVRGQEAIAERPDGTRVPFMPYPTSLFDTAGKLVGAVNLLMDITDQKRAEAQARRMRVLLEERVETRSQALAEASDRLMQSEQTFKLLVQSVTDYAIFMLDPTGYVANWNLGAERIKGYQSAEIVGQLLTVFGWPVAKIIIVVAKGERLPPAPRGHTWQLVIPGPRKPWSHLNGNRRRAVGASAPWGRLPEPG